jgi:Protein of unknown function (DUF3592)
MQINWVPLMAAAPFIGLLAVATIVKYVQVRRARPWGSVPGRIVSAKAVSKMVRRLGADRGDSSEDTEARNFAEVVYEYKVGGKKLKGSRVSCGEDLGNIEVAETLARYKPGAEVTVFYNPVNPDEAVLERDPPQGAFKFMAWLLVAIAAFAILASVGFTRLHAMISDAIPNPKNAPFVVGFGLFAVFTALFARGLQKQAAMAKGWPKTPGRIVQSGTEQFQSRTSASNNSGPRSGTRTMYRQRVTYSYVVKGVPYVSDRVDFGARTKGTIESLELDVVKRYAPGSTVTVYYDPKNPTQAVLDPGVRMWWLLWLCVAGFAAAAYWFATTSGWK